MLWEESKHTNYKPMVKTSQMQSCQETLTKNCATKAETYQAPPKVSHQRPRISYPTRCDGWREASHNIFTSAKGNETQIRRCSWSKVRPTQTPESASGDTSKWQRWVRGYSRVRNNLIKRHSSSFKEIVFAKGPGISKVTIGKENSKA